MILEIFTSHSCSVCAVLWSVINSYHFNLYWFHTQQLCYISHCTNTTTIIWFLLCTILLSKKAQNDFWECLLSTHNLWCLLNFSDYFNILGFFWLLLVFFFKMLYIQVALYIKFCFLKVQAVKISVENKYIKFSLSRIFCRANIIYIIIYYFAIFRYRTLVTNLTSAEISEISFSMLVKYSVAIAMTVIEKAARKAVTVLRTWFQCSLINEIYSCRGKNKKIWKNIESLGFFSSPMRIIHFTHFMT